MKVILIGGTWSNAEGYDPVDEWWQLGSPFSQAAATHGLECLSFAWSTELDGVVGKESDWEDAANVLYRQAKDLQPVTVLAHSHGGNVAAWAAAIYPLKFRKLITMGTPVRPDVPYDQARLHIEDWTHLYGNYKDYWQILGELALFRFWRLRRKMPLADKNIQLPVDHEELHEIATWDKYGLWDLLNE